MKFFLRNFLCILVSVVLIICSLCLGTFGANGATVTYFLGDADLSGQITIADVSVIQKHLAEISTLNSSQQYLADVDGSAGLTIRDATVVQLYIVKKDYNYTANSGGYIIGQAVEFSNGTPIEPTTSTNPVGALDWVSSSYKSVSVRGWAFDEDDYNASIEVHIYIGGPADSGEGHSITAGNYRADVNSAYGCGDYHGFDASLSTDMVGRQKVYAYAINIEGGDNQLIGTADVNIPGDFSWDSDGEIEAAAYQISTSSVKVDFDGEFGATRYAVRAYSDSGLNNLVSKNNYATDEGATISGLSTDTTYYFTVQAYNDAGALTQESEYCKVYMMPKCSVKSAKARYYIENLPCARRVFQNFYVDTVTNILYVTQVSPVYDSSANLIREDTVLAKCPIKGNTATCESFMLIKSGGHGTILNGYYTSAGNLRFYIGCAYSKSLDKITAIARIGYEDAYANKYDASTGRWTSYDGTVISYEHKPDDGSSTGSELTGAGFCNDGIGIADRRITNVDTLVPSGATFQRFDFIRCGGAGQQYFLVKYKQSGTIYLGVYQCNTNIDSKLSAGTSSYSVSTLSTTLLTKVKGNKAFFNGNWQSSGINDTSTAISPQWFTSGNAGSYGVLFKDLKSNRAYVADADLSGFIRGEQETEGIKFIDGELYFGHKFVDYSTNTRLLTIQSIPLS